jgi:hypothetical protein
MHRVDETRYGYRVVFEGFLQQDDVGELLSNMKTTIRPRGNAFALLFDMRKSRAFPAEVRELLRQALHFCKEAGMERNAVVLSSAIATLQARRLARESGVEEWSRYIDASHPDWEKIAVDWLVRAVEPELS